MLSPQSGTAEGRAGAARAFVRSLNILLKYVRLYGLDHKLTAAQLDTAWQELCAAMPHDAEAGFSLGVSGSQMLLDGKPLAASSSERSFAEMFSAAGLAGIDFSARVEKAEFLRLIVAFSLAGTRPAALVHELKRACGESHGHIQVKEVRYVARDASPKAPALPARATNRPAGQPTPQNGKPPAPVSPEAWRIPARDLGEKVRQLLERGEIKTAAAILDAYSDGIRSANPEVRRRTAQGLSEIAETYAQAGPELLHNALQRTGEQLQSEPEPEAQSLLASAVMRLTNEAATRSDFLAIRQAIDFSDALAKHRADLGADVRRGIAVESRMPKFVADVLHEPTIPDGFVEMLRREPRAAADELAAQHSRCHLREESDRLLELARSAGPQAVERLIDVLRSHAPSKAISTIGLLSYLDAGALHELLPDRLPRWGSGSHDAVIRQIGIGAAEERGQLLLELLDLFDAAVLPAVVDAIGATSHPLATVRLLRFAQGDLPSGASPYVQVKAIEALSRLQDTHAAPLLHELLSARGMLGWKYPRELRIVAAQTLMKLESWFDVPTQSGLTQSELKLAPLDPEPALWVRQRRYSRIATEQTVPAFLETSRERCGVKIGVLSLGGGQGERDGRVTPGTQATLNLRVGLRNLSSRVVVRDSGRDDMAFEIIHITHQDRFRLRRLLLDQPLPLTASQAMPLARSAPVRSS